MRFLARSAEDIGVIEVLLIDCLIDQVFKNKIARFKKVILNTQGCVSAVHPDMMYNHDNYDIISYFGGHFVFQFEKGGGKEFGMGQIWNQHIRIV